MLTPRTNHPDKGSLPKEWFIVYSGMIYKVTDECDRLGLHWYYPMYTRRWTPRNAKKYANPKQVEVESPLFPGYLFLAAGKGVDPNNLSYISGVLETEPNKYARIQNAYIEELQEAISRGEFDDVKGLREVFTPGQLVRVGNAEHAFAGLAGEIETAMSGRPAKLLLDIFGRVTRVSIDLQDLEAA